MSLNIKNEEAHKMAAELAELRGVSMTAVVLEALRKELDEERRKRVAGGKAKRILALVRRLNEGRPKGEVSSDHSWLYDENGLPCQG